MKKPPPHFTEGEKAVLGACLLSNDIVSEACEILADTDFYHKENREVFRAIQKLSGQDCQIDWVSVTRELKKAGAFERVGGAVYLAALGDGVPSAANWKHYAEHVQKAAALRTTIATTTEILTACYAFNADPAEIQERFQKAAFTNIASPKAKKLSSMKEIVPKILTLIEDGKTNGIPSGLPTLDFFTKGFRAKELIFVGGRTGMGKSALALDFAVSACKKTSVALFSLEMSEEEIGSRLVAKKAGVNLQRIRSGGATETDWRLIWPVIDSLTDFPLLIDDSGSLTVSHIKGRVREASVRLGVEIGMVVVDYVQLMKAETKQENEVLRIGEITRDLKILSKDMNCCVICLSQLNRKVEQRPFKNGGRIPQLDDFRASGRIEEDSDIIIGIYRPLAYEKEILESERDRYKDQALAVILKQRNGPTGIAKLSFNAPTATFRSPVPEGVVEPYMEKM